MAKFLEMGIDCFFTNDYLFAFYGANGKRKAESGVFRVFTWKNTENLIYYKERKKHEEKMANFRHGGVYDVGLGGV